MTAVLGTRLHRPKYTMAELVGVWFMAGFTFAGFFSLPISGRIPMILVSMIGVSSLFFYTKEQLGRIRLSVPVMLLTAWICLSYLWSISPWRTLVGLQYYVVVTIAMICVVSVMSVELVVKGLLRGFYGTIVVTWLSLVLEPGKTLVDDNGYRSIHGWFFHKNSMAPYMVMAIAFIIPLEQREKVRKWMVFLAGALIVGSLSATGLIALVLVAGFDYLARHLVDADRARRTTMVVGAIAASMGIAYAVTTYLPQIVGVYGKDATLSGRTDIWASVWRAFEQRPMLGYGLDAAFQGPSKLINVFYTEIGFVPTHSHNGLLDVAISGGLVAVVLTVWVFLAVFRDSWRYSVLGVPFARAMFVVTAMFLVMSVTESTMGWPNMILIFMFRIVLLRWKAGEVPAR